MGLRAGHKTGWSGGRSNSVGKLAASLLLMFLCLESFSQANRLPKFPSALKVSRDSKDTLKPSSTRTVQSEPETESAQKTGTNATLQQLEEEKQPTLSHAKTGGQNNTGDGSGSNIDHNVAQSLEDQWKVAGSNDSVEDPESTVLVKARLKPNDVLKKGGKKRDPHAKLMSGGKHSMTYNYTESRAKRSGKMDIVLTHYDLARTEEMVNYWLSFLQSEKVQALKPYVFIYCQNERYDLDEGDFRPILQLGGEIQHLPNVGRESHAYLEHITKRYNELADYTLFAQDASDIQLPERFEMLFEEGRTGFLPLSLVGHVDCDDPFLPAGVIPQIYAMFANELCPPVGYTSSFEGQFVVSKPRIQRNSFWTYQRLLDVLSADESHWIHQKHDNQHYKSKSNPLFGHVLERAWSVAFDCFESWREGNCWQCIVVQGMHNCGEGDCQCFDKNS